MILGALVHGKVDQSLWCSLGVPSSVRDAIVNKIFKINKLKIYYYTIFFFLTIFFFVVVKNVCMYVYVYIYIYIYNFFFNVLWSNNFNSLSIFCRWCVILVVLSGGP